MKKMKLVVGYTWKNGELYLQTRDPNPYASTEDILLSGDFWFKLHNERHCIGWIDFNKLEIMPCPDFAVVPKYQCEKCKEKEGFIQCVMCDGFKCPPLKPAVEKYCKQTHHLYFACFGGKSVKVGTASGVRKEVRIWEQGPLAAAYIAHAPGPKIKQIEHTVSGLGYTEFMHRTEKRTLLTSGMKESEAKDLIQKAYEDITSRISPIYQSYFHTLEFASIPIIAKESRKFDALDEMTIEFGKVKGGHVLAGSGNFLIVDDGTGPISIDLSNFKSHLIELDPEGPHTIQTKQLTLF